MSVVTDCNAKTWTLTVWTFLTAWRRAMATQLLSLSLSLVSFFPVLSGLLFCIVVGALEELQSVDLNLSVLCMSSEIYVCT